MSKSRLNWIFFLIFYFGIYGAIFPGNFHYDDYHSIRNNSWIVSVKNIPQFFIEPGCFSSRPRAQMFRPMLLVSYALDYQVYGWRTWGWHLTNLLLHFFNVLLVWVIFKRAFKKEKLAWIASLVYAFHPIASENINYINCRSSILLCSFMFLGIYALQKFLEPSGKKRALWVGLVGLFFILSVLSKESGVVFPGIAFVYYWIFSEAQKKQKIKAAVYLVLPMAIILLGYLFLRMIFFERVFSGSSLPRPYLVNFLTELKAYFWYLGLFLFPTRLSIEHSLAVESGFFNPRVIISALGLSGLAMLVIYSILKPYSRLSRLGFFIGFYLLALVPTTSFVPLNLLVSERALYPGLFGLVGILALGLGRISEIKLRVFLSCFGLILVSYSAMAIYRARVWQSEWGVWKDAFHKAPDNPRVIGQLGNEYYKKDEIQKAVKYLAQSDQLLAGHPITVFNLGAIYMDLGRLEEAERYLTEAVALEANDVEARVNLAVVYRTQGKLELAKYHLEQAILVKPDSALAHNNLGDVYFNLGDVASAEREFKKAIEIDSSLEDAHFNLGRILEAQGRYQSALAHFQKAYQLNSAQSDNPLWVGIMYLRLKNLEKAEEWIKRALALNENYDFAWYYLALAKKEQGEKSEALLALNRARNLLNPNHLELEQAIKNLRKELSE